MDDIPELTGEDLEKAVEIAERLTRKQESHHGLLTPEEAVAALTELQYDRATAQQAIAHVRNERTTTRARETLDNLLANTRNLALPLSEDDVRLEYRGTVHPATKYVGALGLGSIVLMIGAIPLVAGLWAFNGYTITDVVVNTLQRERWMQNAIKERRQLRNDANEYLDQFDREARLDDAVLYINGRATRIGTVSKQMNGSLKVTGARGNETSVDVSDVLCVLDPVATYTPEDIGRAVPLLTPVRITHTEHFIKKTKQTTGFLESVSKDFIYVQESHPAEFQNELIYRRRPIEVSALGPRLK